METYETEAARKMMLAMRGDQGRVCPPEAWPERGRQRRDAFVPASLWCRPNWTPELEAAVRRIVVGTTTGGGDSNIWAGSADVVATPNLAS